MAHNMQRDEVSELVVEQIVNVLPHLSKDQVAAHKRLKDLGADSVARADIYAMSMEAMDLDLPLVAFAQIVDVGGLVDLLYSSVGAVRSR